MALSTISLVGYPAVYSLHSEVRRRSSEALSDPVDGSRSGLKICSISCKQARALDVARIVRVRGGYSLVTFWSTLAHLFFVEPRGDPSNEHLV